MLDPQFIQEHKKEVRQAAIDKGISIDLDRYFVVDEERRKLIHEAEALRHQQRLANTNIAKAKGAEKNAAVSEMKKVSDKVKKLEERLRTVEREWKELVLMIPNIPASSVPKGKDETGNVELLKKGKIPTFDFPAKTHLELGRDLDIIDIERGVKLAGSRGYVLKGAGARMEMALMQYGIDFLEKRGYTLMIPPTMVKAEFLEGSGHFPWGKDEVFKTIDKEKEAYLVGTAEVPVTGYHAHEVLDGATLPLRYGGFSTCYRTEIGSYGKDTKGLYRLRQFTKVEQVIFCEASEEVSQKMFQEILTNALDFLETLGLPTRVIQKCTGDMSAKSIEEADIEVWMPSRNAYGETHTCSRFGDFQARRLNIKYVDGAGKKRFVYTLNNTLIASPRILIPILELNQQKDGSVAVPKVLQPYMGNRHVLEKIKRS